MRKSPSLFVVGSVYFILFFEQVAGVRINCLSEARRGCRLSRSPFCVSAIASVGKKIDALVFRFKSLRARETCRVRETVRNVRACLSAFLGLEMGG